MNRPFTLLLASVLAFVVAFTLTHYSRRPPAIIHQMPELGWLRNELKLSEAQLEQAAALHKAYQPTCEALCAKINDARIRVRKAAGSRTMTEELSLALEEQARVHADCQKAMIAHLYETASLMTPEQAARYLDATLPHATNLSAYEHLPER